MKVTSAPESSLAVIVVASGCPRSHSPVFCFFAFRIRTFNAFRVLLISSATELLVGEGVTGAVDVCGVNGTLGELGEGFNKCLGAQFVPGTVWLA